MHKELIILDDCNASVMTSVDTYNIHTCITFITMIFGLKRHIYAKKELKSNTDIPREIT